MAVFEFDTLNIRTEPGVLLAARSLRVFVAVEGGT